MEPIKTLREYEHRVCVNGSRSYNNYPEFKANMDRVLRWLGKSNLCIITGVASAGADHMVLQWCREQNIPWFEFPADWDQYGKRAGYIRNSEMRDACTHLFSFWDKQSKGTSHMIDECLKHEDIRLFVYLVEPDPDYYEKKFEKKKEYKGIIRVEREDEQSTLKRWHHNREQARIKHHGTNDFS